MPNLACVLLLDSRQQQIGRIDAMLEYIKRKKQVENVDTLQQNVPRIEDENEYLALSCGTFNPRFLAKIKRSLADKPRQ